MDGNQRISYRERRVNSRAGAARNVQMNVSLFPRGFSDEVPGSSPPRAPRAQRITDITGTASVDRRGLAWDQKDEINPMAKPKIMWKAWALNIHAESPGGRDAVGLFGCAREPFKGNPVPGEGF